VGKAHARTNEGNFIGKPLTNDGLQKKGFPWCKYPINEDRVIPYTINMSKGKF